MEEKETRKIYFIYAQNGYSCNIDKFELNDKIIKVTQLYRNIEKLIYNHILYCAEVLNNNNENEVTLTLIDINGDKYSSLLVFNEQEGEEIINTNEKIFFKLIFEPHQGKNNLNQFTLSADKQLKIFEDNFQNDDKKLINLYLSLINQVLIKEENKFDLILNVFYKIYNENKYENLPELKNVLKYFFKNMKRIIKNCKHDPSLIFPKEQVDIISDIENIREKLIQITGEQAENIDIFLSYFYIFYRQELFTQFLFNPNYTEILFKTLTSNRELFNNFTIDVITPQLIDKANSINEFIYLMGLYPNIPELFKILSYDSVSKNLSRLYKKEKKSIDLMLIQKPQENDDINSLLDSFNKFYLGFIGKNPIIIEEDFFIEYYKLFEGKSENFHKAASIIKLLEIYNNLNKKIINFENILELHLKNGISLLKQKKLKNLDFFDFLNTFPDLTKKNPELMDYFQYAIEYNEKDQYYINRILNDENYKFVIKSIFDNFKKPIDIAVFRKWNITMDTPKTILANFLQTVKRIWINNPENYLYYLDNLLENSFAVASLNIENFQDIINELEAKIEKEKLMRIYSELLFKDYIINVDFKKHIKDYIVNYDKTTPMYIYYIASTYPDRKSQIEILKNYLENEGDYFAVKYSDFVGYPKYLSGRLYLFTRLSIKKLLDAFIETEYYSKSFDAKNHIEQNIVKDAFQIELNIKTIFDLLISFFTKTDEDLNNLSIKIIIFLEKVEKARKYSDSLKSIHDFWTLFFPKEKAADLNKLKNIIDEFENRKLENCMDEGTLDKTFLNYVPEAEKGNQLSESLIFMEIYNKMNNIEEQETKRYNLCLEKFNQIEKLGNNINFNLLDNDLKENIINVIEKNTDSLDNELNLIEKYFKFNEKLPNNFDKKSLKKIISDLIKINQMKKEENKIGVPAENIKSVD